jgi:hypothetical protein
MKYRALLLALPLLWLDACAKGPSTAGSSSAAAAGELPPAPPLASAGAASPATGAAAVAPAPASKPEPMPAPSGGTMTNDAKWTIHFDPQGISTLRNGTGRAYSVLHDSNLQPSRLEVTDAQGKVAPVFDQRSIMKFDNTVRKEAFVRIESGAELPLFPLRINPREDRFELGWGPFLIGPLPVGHYTGTVIFEAREEHYFDEATRTKKRLGDAWVGTVRSAPAPIMLGAKPP